jgi:hypothetical protein
VQNSQPKLELVAQCTCSDKKLGADLKCSVTILKETVAAEIDIEPCAPQPFVSVSITPPGGAPPITHKIVVRKKFLLPNSNLTDLCAIWQHAVLACPSAAALLLCGYSSQRVGGHCTDLYNGMRAGTSGCRIPFFASTFFLGGSYFIDLALADVHCGCSIAHRLASVRFGRLCVQAGASGAGETGFPIPGLSFDFSPLAEAGAVLDYDLEVKTAGDTVLTVTLGIDACGFVFSVKKCISVCGPFFWLLHSLFALVYVFAVPAYAYVCCCRDSVKAHR